MIGSTGTDVAVAPLAIAVVVEITTGALEPNLRISPAYRVTVELPEIVTDIVSASAEAAEATVTVVTGGREVPGSKALIQSSN
jgi:hypothetical protein